MNIEETDNNSPTIEDVKKIVDSKRIKRSTSKTYTREDRIKNLELAREKRKQKQQQVDISKNKKEEVLEDDDVIEKEPERSTVSNIKKTLVKHKSQYNNLNTLSDLYETINNIKELISSQSKVIEDAIKPKPKEKKQRKPKEQSRTLDISISDTEIKKIIENKENTNIKKNDEIEDVKLKSFLDALNKK
jgi:hypothetical protein